MSDGEAAWREWMGVHETGVEPRPMSGAMVAALREVFDAGFAAASEHNHETCGECNHQRTQARIEERNEVIARHIERPYE